MAHSRRNDEPAKNLWFARDPAAMAKAKNWGTVAPFYVDQEAPLVPGGLPHVGPLKVNLPNNHLGYAVTWYGLRGCLGGGVALFCPQPPEGAGALTLRRGPGPFLVLPGPPD